MSRFILRYSGAGTPSEELIEQLRSFTGIAVLDSSPRMFLLEGSQADLDRAMRKIAGWRLVPETMTPLPDTRVKLAR